MQALVVEVRGPSGTLLKGTTVRFNAQPVPDSVRQGYATSLFVCALAVPICGPADASSGSYGVITTASADTTDANGRAKATVRLGTIAGPTYVIVTVPEYGMKDSVPYTVLPGAAHNVSFTSRNVAVMVGARIALKASVVDAYGNARADAVTYTLNAPTAIATFDAASATVTGVGIGTGSAVAQVDGAMDTATVHVVPPGRLVLADLTSLAVRSMNTDGSAFQTLATDITSSFGVFPRFSPNGSVVVFQAALDASGGTPQRIIVTDSAGGHRREIGLPSGLTLMMQPVPLATGAVLFVGREGPQPAGFGISSPTAVYSVAPDNTVTNLALMPNASPVFDGAAISADGSRVAYVLANPNGYGEPAGLRVLTVATGQTTLIDPTGVAPSWSAAGDRLAFLVPPFIGNNGGTLAIVNADGSGRTAFTAAGTFLPGLAWSPNRDYVLGRIDSGGPLRAVRLADGVTVDVPLPSSNPRAYPGSVGDYYQPDWR